MLEDERQRWFVVPLERSIPCHLASVDEVVAVSATPVPVDSELAREQKPLERNLVYVNPS